MAQTIPPYLNLYIAFTEKVTNLHTYKHTSIHTHKHTGEANKSVIMTDICAYLPVLQY